MLMLIVALVAAVVAPNALGRRTNGSPVAEAIAGAPTVGQCVTAITSSSGRDREPAGTVDAFSHARSLPVATLLQICAGTVIGEVISVTPANSASSSTTLDEYYWANPSCPSQVERYLGTAARSDILGVQWSKSLSLNALTVGPDAHDRAAGRTWTACVLVAVNQSYTAPLPLQSSWTNRLLPDAFGLCWAEDIVPHGVPTPCTSAHTTQQLASGFVAGPSDSSTSIVSAADPAAVLAGCRQLATTMMMVSDPTFRGALRVEVVSDPISAPYVQCAVSVAGGRKLVRSLIGLAGRSLPLA